MNGSACVIISLTGMLVPRSVEIVHEVSLPPLFGEVALMLRPLIKGATPGIDSTASAANWFAYRGLHPTVHIVSEGVLFPPQPRHESSSFCQSCGECVFRCDNSVDSLQSCRVRVSILAILENLGMIVPLVEEA
jgi:hypothetical protein